MNLPSIYTIKTYLCLRSPQRLYDTRTLTNQSALISFEQIMARETRCPHQSHCHPAPVSMSELISHPRTVRWRKALRHYCVDHWSGQIRTFIWGADGSTHDSCHVVPWTNTACVWTANDSLNMMRLYRSHYNQRCLFTLWKIIKNICFPSSFQFIFNL